MLKIIQDYHNWKEAKKNTVVAQQNVSKKFNSMLGQISLPHFGHNISIESAFIKSAPDPKTQPQECKQYMDTYSHICHAYPCFYVIYNPFDHIGVNKVYTEKQAQRCMNNLEDGTIYETFCRDCDAFKDLVQYQSLYAQFKMAQEKQNQAKQKLLDNFRFWKQHTK